jgi:AmmeMemoRadiSam system protein B
MDLEFLPSPIEDRPGLMIRDPYHFSDAVLIIPPVLIECLELFDGEHSELDLKELLVRRTGRLDLGEAQQNLIDALSRSGFVHDEYYRSLRESRFQEFREAVQRLPIHAGSAYPGEAGELRAALADYLSEGAVDGHRGGSLAGIAAPHVSPEGGWTCYQAAYRALDESHKGRTFVILGTSHYGEPEKFGVTRKNFVTPLGEAICDTQLAEKLIAEGGRAVVPEDYCHAVEHSIEFQVIFLQHVLGPDVRILPILCGSYAKSIYRGGMPEDDEGVRRFLGALGEMHAREQSRLTWVLGIDMAHMGRRYGDNFAAEADQGEMEQVARRDRERIDRVNQGDAAGFWSLVQERNDDLKWCGSSPLYTFLKAVPAARGELLRYGQWNIDGESVVSFAGIAFR